jgi:hypothetical protein
MSCACPTQGPQPSEAKSNFLQKSFVLAPPNLFVVTKIRTGQAMLLSPSAFLPFHLIYFFAMASAIDLGTQQPVAVSYDIPGELILSKPVANLRVDIASGFTDRLNVFANPQVAGGSAIQVMLAPGKHDAGSNQIINEVNLSPLRINAHFDKIYYNISDAQIVGNNDFSFFQAFMAIHSSTHPI